MKLLSVGWWGEYGWMGEYDYHYDCVKDAIKNPKKYGNRKVDMALEIHRCIEHHMNEHNEERKRQEVWRNQELRRLQGMI